MLKWSTMPEEKSELPDTCYSTLPSSGELIMLKRGESGYYPPDFNPIKLLEHWGTGRQAANALNARAGITRAQEEAMVAGSMFGWNMPGANPAKWERHLKRLARMDADEIERGCGYK